MSQINQFMSIAMLGAVDSLTGDAGGAIGPDGVGNINILGGTNIATAGAGTTITINLEATIGVALGGTGLTTITDHGVMVGSGVGAVTALAVGTTNNVLTGVTGADPAWAQVALASMVTGILPVANGGTGLNTITDHGLMVGAGVGNVTPLAVGATGEMLIGNTGADPSWSVTGALTTLNVTTVNATTVNATTFDTNIAAAGVTLDGTSLIADGTDANIDINITAKGTGQVIIDDLQLTAPLTVPYGGTGVATLTDHGILLGSGVGTVTPLGVATDGQIPIGSTGIDPVLATITAGTDVEVTNAAGSITVGLTADADMTAVHGWNGSLIETATVLVSEAGGVITLSVTGPGTSDLTAVFSDGFYDWDCTPADTVVLTAGSDIAPQINYVYLLQSTKTLTASIVGWPATEFAAIAIVMCQSAASLGTDGTYFTHVWTDHVVNPADQGHVSMIDRWIRQQHATWSSGVAPTLTITPQGGAADNVIFTCGAGIVYQLHAHTFPAFAGTPDVYTVNNFTTPYNVVTDLNALLIDSANVSMSGKYFTLVIWGAVSETTGDCNLYVNLPGGSYNTEALLLADSSRYANFSIPANFTGVGFLIYQMNLKHSVAASGTWTSVSNINLRGLFPSLAAGGSTSFATEFADNVFRIIDNGDNTKEIAFEASAITTATTRTITMDDRDIDMDAVPTSFSTDGAAATPAAGALTVAGGTNITTAGAGSTVTANLDATITLTTVNATTFDTNVAAAGVTLAGTSLIADGTDADISINITAKGTGQVIIDDLQLTTDLTVPYGGTGASTHTDHGVLVGQGVAAITALAVGTDGQVLVGDSANDPVFATLSSTGTIAFTPGAGTLALDCRAATDALTGVVELATDAEAIAGAAATVINCTSLKAKLGTQTDHGVLVGSGTAGAITALGVATNGQVIVGSTGADPVIATIGSTDGSITVTGGAGTLVLEGTAASTAQVGSVELTTDAEAIAGTDTTRAVTAEALKAKLGTQTDHGVLVGSATTGALTALAVGTNGQVLVGSSAADPVFATITDGTGITTTLGAGTLTIASTGTTLNNETGTTDTWALADAGKFITYTNAAAIAVTVPTNAAVAFPIGTQIGFMQGGAGQVTFAGAVPPTLRSADSALTTVKIYSVGYATKIATDEWVFGGDLEA